MIADQLLTKAAEHMQARAKTYDSPQGERSMAKAVTAFNVITNNMIDESEGWLFMAILKMVRSEQNGLHTDSIEDLIAYASLYGEAKITEDNDQYEALHKSYDLRQE